MRILKKAFFLGVATGLLEKAPEIRIDWSRVQSWYLEHGYPLKSPPATPEEAERAVFRFIEEEQARKHDDECMPSFAAIAYQCGLTRNEGYRILRKLRRQTDLESIRRHPPLL